MRNFWDTNIITGTTINYIPTPAAGPFSINIICYFVIILIAGIIFLKYKNSSFKKTATFSLLIGFVAATVVFSLRMDLNWIELVKQDRANLYGKDIREKFAYLDGSDFFEFIEFVRSSIPPGESARTEFNFDSDLERQVYEMGRYYLLPTLTSREGRYIWVYHRQGSSYDAQKGILRIDKKTSYKVRPHALYRNGAGIFKIEQEL